MSGKLTKANALGQRANWKTFDDPASQFSNRRFSRIFADEFAEADNVRGIIVKGMDGLMEESARETRALHFFAIDVTLKHLHFRDTPSHSSLALSH